MQILTAVKKPIEIEAVHYDGSLWCGRSIEKWSQGEVRVPDTGSKASLYVETLEGLLFVRPDSYVIRGIKGEYYPCDPVIFHESYEIVGTEEQER